MFETNYRNSLPGYTGHVPGKIENDAPAQNKEARKHIPGKPLFMQLIFQAMEDTFQELRVRMSLDKLMVKSVINLVL